ncbi:hypothetical protein RSAG8_11091, partial [Rhizoctonia solani AG-8 WAC10335]
MAYRNTEVTGTTTNTSDTNNNLDSHPPELSRDLDIFASTSLKDSQDKDTLLENIGYLRGIRVDSNDGPQNLTRRVAEFVGDAPPLVQEINDFVTESITTKTERETNYIHSGWSIAAASTISPWISSRIAANNQPDAEGTWITRRTLVQRFRVRVSPEDLVPIQEFKAEMETALNRPTIFQQFEAVYRALHKWGDVVPLEVEMGASLAFTDHEANMSQLPTTAWWFDTRYLATIRTARTTRQAWRHRLCGLGGQYMAKTNHISSTLAPDKDKNSNEYNPTAPSRGPGPAFAATHDDTHHAAKTISGVTIYTSDYIRTVKFDYADKSKSNKHEGSESQGSEHKMVLTDGEYITEIFVWKHDWIDGVQFVTNFGRCSPHFGGLWGTPTVWRNKGGVLAGIISLIKQHSYGRLFRDFQGIWRYDAVDTVPKEEDVFSDYFGSQAGKPFNDRVVVRNTDIAISKIEHEAGGTSVSGKYDDQQITQINFVTDQGRSSGILGQGKAAGESRSFSVSSPKDKGGKRMRLQYVCGKSDTQLNGIMFAWTPM